MALYPVSPIINEVLQVKEVITTEPGTEKPIHTLDDAVGVEDEYKYLRAKLHARDQHIRELMATVARQRKNNENEIAKVLARDHKIAAVDGQLADRKKTIGAMHRTIVALRKDVADRNALIKEQGDTLRRFRAMRNLTPEEPKTDVLMKEQRFYFDGPWDDPK